MWIRSQDKGLHNVISFDSPKAEYNQGTITGYSINGVICQGVLKRLGRYKSEERAYQVIGEIEKTIITPLSKEIFQMPEK